MVYPPFYHILRIENFLLILLKLLEVLVGSALRLTGVRPPIETLKIGAHRGGQLDFHFYVGGRLSTGQPMVSQTHIFAIVQTHIVPTVVIIIAIIVMGVEEFFIGPVSPTCGHQIIL